MSRESARSPDSEDMPLGYASTRGMFFRAPMVAAFFVVSLLLWLIGSDEERLRHLSLELASPTIESFLASHLFHRSGLELVFNLLVIVVTGAILETRWGTTRFVAFYFVCAWGSTGLTLALATLFGVDGFTCGSASVAFGCLVCVGYLFPEIRLLRWVPPNRYLVWMVIFVGASLLVLLEVVERTAAPPGPYYSPQVTGVPLTLLFLKLLPIYDKWLWRRLQRREEEARSRVREIRERVDQLLEKISNDGYESLSRDELNFLRSASKHFSDGA